jgi:hypothetical protein
MFRDVIARTNIAYSMIRVGRKGKRKEVEALVVRTIREKRRKYITGKIIVYGNNKEKVQ